jgi:hypothetical protein
VLQLAWRLLDVCVIECQCVCLILMSFGVIMWWTMELSCHIMANAGVDSYYANGKDHGKHGIKNINISRAINCDPKCCVIMPLACQRCSINEELFVNQQW